MNYRPAAENDFAQLAQLRWDFRAEDGEVPVLHQHEFMGTYQNYLQQGLAGNRWTYWVAEEHNKIVSQVFLQIISSIPRPCRVHNDFGYITNVYTKPTYRNQGIGAKLMRRVIEYASELDLELLLVWPSETSIAFYQRAGFQLADDVMKLQLRNY